VRVDFVPVDFVSRAIIISTAAQMNKNELKIIHSSTKHLNSMKLEDYVAKIMDYYHRNPFSNQYRYPFITFVRPKVQKVLSYLYNDLPGQAMLKYSTFTNN